LKIKTVKTVKSFHHFKTVNFERFYYFHPSTISHPFYAAGHPGERPPASQACSGMEQWADGIASCVGVERDDVCVGFQQHTRVSPEIMEFKIE